MDGVGGYAGWRWIFILEGLLTVVVALVAPFAIHDSPETATFLTEEERRFVIHSLRIQNSADSREIDQTNDKFEMRYVLDAFADWQIWLGLFSKFCSFLGINVSLTDPCKVYWGITCPLYGISLFLPSIIKDLGYKSSTAQLLTVSSLFYFLIESEVDIILGTNIYHCSNCRCYCSMGIRQTQATIPFHSLLYGHDRHRLHHLSRIYRSGSARCYVLWYFCRGCR